jgi:spore germination protein KB
MKFPEKGLEEILEEVLGKFLGKIIALAYSVLYLYISALVIRQLEEFFVLAIMPETPPIAFRILYVLVLMLGVYEGTLAILRTNVYIFPVGMLVVGLVVGLATTKMSFDNLTPVFVIGLENILQGSYLTIGWLLQFPFIVLTFFKYIETAKLTSNVKKLGLLSVIVTGVSLLAGALGTIAVFGPNQTATLFYPSFSMARTISIGNFLENIEITFVGVWVAGMYICATVYCFMSILLVTSILKLNDYKKIALPIAGLLFYLPSIVAKDLSSLFSVLRQTFPLLTIVFGGILPTIFLILASIMNKGITLEKLKEEQQEEEESQSIKGNFWRT